VGDKTEGDKTEHSKTEGDKTEGVKTEHDKTEQDKTEGNKTEGDKTEGDKTKGDKSEGDKTEGEKTEGDKTSVFTDRDKHEDIHFYNTKHYKQLNQSQSTFWQGLGLGLKFKRLGLGKLGLAYIPMYHVLVRSRLHPDVGLLVLLVLCCDQ